MLDLNEVWKIVKDDYTNGLINSERCLQCSLYRAMRLNPDKTKSSAQIFIEPAIDLGGGKKIYPDMIVCEKNHILMVMEIKFVPHAYPHFSADLSKLYELSKVNESGWRLDIIDPNTGKYKSEPHTISQETCYVYAAIGQHDSKALCMQDIEKEASIPKNFTLLYGRIGSGREEAFGTEQN